jgi:hypothetical protein
MKEEKIHDLFEEGQYDNTTGITIDDTETMMKMLPLLKTTMTLMIIIMMI